jgi:hypothetical protein
VIKNDKTKLYYDVTGLKNADSKTMEQAGQSVTTSYGDYRAVKV